MTDQQRKCRFRHGLLAAVLSGIVSAPSLADNNDNLYRPVDNWNVDGQHGVVYVKGSLTESPCRLAMTSSYQTVEMGNLDTGTLQHNGKGTPIVFQIELEDCLETATRLENVQSGMTAWSSTQPAVKIRFVAPTVPMYSDFVRVNGAQGLGLAVTTAGGALLPMGQASEPQLLPSGQSRLTYYVTPVRTGALVPGPYSALIAFEMLYE
ncbi:TPA: fimbrial protein [Providencia stuartii]|uniref:fimbrial protein n=2 Tax=Providencia stuartii TaxID=588 RepID=UPI00114051DE|nr:MULTISPECIES: fimbrial protein [Providencia]MBN5560558.1 type 1 fimbrial protein [Providencia stuartii]MBN5600654.1 type 1 fimbrial protein [Providencia stuartii]MBN5604526.1 type 1 fimbrial protein [Providencia stuartii]MCL8327309.1 type 1 fimbrial protein [Providencia thailandensis]MDF4173161.1 fimbrial protein [Providencia thailandensis]